MPRPIGFHRLRVTAHAKVQMQRRGISPEVVALVISLGRRKHLRSALHFFLGRKEVHKHAKRGVDLECCDRVHVIADVRTLTIITVYRDSNPIGRSAKHRGKPRWLELPAWIQVTLEDHGVEWAA